MSARIYRICAVRNTSPPFGSLFLILARQSGYPASSASPKALIPMASAARTPERVPASTARITDKANSPPEIIIFLCLVSHTWFRVLPAA